MADDVYCDMLEEPSMEICVETLTGTSFEMRVCPQDSISNIKSRIERVEGIPAHHQNLLFQMTELEDHKTLDELGITNGSTLKLVLSMRGGPISTRRLTYEHHLAWKDVKELIEHARDHLFQQGPKISLFIFKEGDMVNLLRVIENDDGTCTPFSAKEQDKTERSFDKLLEDDRMLEKLTVLREKLRAMNLRRHAKEQATKQQTNANKKTSEKTQFSYRLLGEMDPYMEKELEVHENDILSGEIALKEKHRTKMKTPANVKPKSQFAKTKGLYSVTKGLYAATGASNTKSQDSDEPEAQQVTESDNSSPRILRDTPSAPRSEVQIARLVLPDNAERPKSTPDSLELEGNVQDVWEIHEGAERVENSATCKVGVVKRRQSVECTFDANYGMKKAERDVGEFSCCKNGDFEVFGTNFFQISSNPSTVSHRAPLYGRKPQNEFDLETASSLPSIRPAPVFPSGASNIQRLCNNYQESGGDHQDNKPFGMFRSSAHMFFPEPDRGPKLSLRADEASEQLANEIKKIGCPGEKLELPAIKTKKTLRCDQCNRKLNVTNNYTCRCGKLFCGQHRYSEVHGCKYDYKTSGRLILEQQNPLVVAEKLRKI